MFAVQTSNLADRILAHHTENVEIRHDLHRHPELGYQERFASGLVQRTLSDLGLEYVSGVAETGVLAYLPATHPGGQTVALRADMDALPIKEATGKPYASENDGKMHACGHDGHTTILLGTVKVLREETERPNNVLFVFQPAEEGGAGGEKMCLEGALKGSLLGTPVDRMFGLHGYPDMSLGHVATRVGPLLAAASEFSITVTGKGGHAAYPHFGVDPVVVAAHIITALQTIASRNVGPLDSVVVTIGSVDAGFAHNVIPNTAVMNGTLRTLRDETDVLSRQRINEISQGVAAAMGAHAEVRWIGAYPVVNNDREATEFFNIVARKTLGEEKVEEAPEPSMGGEDFAFYGREVPSCFFFLGLKPEGQDSYPGLHTPLFDFNDDAIPVGIRLMAELALAI